jgi:hypothetical protein
MSRFKEDIVPRDKINVNNEFCHPDDPMFIRFDLLLSFYSKKIL